MYQKYLIPLVGLITATGSFAGQITTYVGGQSGLTSSYITSNGGSLASWAEKSYTVALFNQTTVSVANATSNGATLIPTTNTAPTGSGNVMTDSNLGISYNLIEDGSTGGNANNFWSAAGSTPGTLIVPINIVDPTLVGMMLNDIWGYAGNNPTITFNFANAGAVAVSLTDGNNGPLRSSTDCTSSTGSITCPGTIAGGHTVSAGAPITSPITSTNSGITVKTDTIWSSTYASNTTSTAGPFANGAGNGSSGNVMLDDMTFNLGNYSTDTLLSISFAAPANTGNNISRLALSAITVESGTPEPSTDRKSVV